MSPVRILICGAGDRGNTYAQYAKLCPDKLVIAGVAEPRTYQREHMAREFNIPPENVFTSWEEAAKREKFADAVIISVQDRMHTQLVLAFAAKKYHILCEKPMSPDEDECRQIYKAVKANGIIFAVCHVLRYTAYTAQVKEIVDSGVLGDIVCMQHHEPVGFWHQAHSFVRGNWRNEGLSSPMLLQKSCHDLDWIRYIMNKTCTRVSSFGSLHYFKKSEQPQGAAERCLDCPAHVETQCPYSARRIYYNFLNKGHRDWPVDVLVPEADAQKLETALREGPYGRCVFACDNDVVDHQVVNMEFADGATATFTMTAFTLAEGRKTVIHGTKGFLVGDSREVKVCDFLTQTWKTYDPSKLNRSKLSGHGGGDGGLIENFVDAVAKNDPSLIISGPEISLETHLMVFAAERARRNGTVEAVQLDKED